MQGHKVSRSRHEDYFVPKLTRRHGRRGSETSVAFGLKPRDLAGVRFGYHSLRKNNSSVLDWNRKRLLKFFQIGPAFIVEDGSPTITSDAACCEPGQNEYSSNCPMASLMHACND